jgi:hypothetical protein
MTYSAPLIVLPAMTLYAGGRIDSAVDLMLAEVISAVGQIAGNVFLIFVAGLQFFFMRMAIGTEGLTVAQPAGLFLLISIKLVPPVEIRRMAERRARVGMAFTAYPRTFNFSRVPGCQGFGMSAGVQ